MHEEIIQNFLKDLQILSDMYSESAVIDALNSVTSSQRRGSIAENKKLIFEVTRGLTSAALAALKILGIPLRGASAMGGRMAGKQYDQDVNIADQDFPLEVKSDEMKELMLQTTELVQQTNDILADLAVSMELSAKGITGLDYSVDDLIAATTGKSVGDVRASQSAFGSSRKEREEELPPEHEERRA